MLFLMLNFPSYAMHEAIDCITCHSFLSVQNEEILVSNRDVNYFCLTCHDQGVDQSGLNPPYVMNNNGQIAGGDFINSYMNDKLGA